MSDQFDRMLDLLDAKDAEITRLTQENERMREALEFYSCDETNCDCQPIGKNRKTLSCGYFARAALTPIPDPAGGMPVEVKP